MKTARYIGILIILTCIIGGCAKKSGVTDLNAYKKEIDEWQKKRLARLTRDDGWLTLAGLSWLKEGENSVGSDSSTTVLLPAGKTPGSLGSIWLENGALRFVAKAGVEVKYKDSLITSMPLKSDADDEPTVLSHGTVSFYVIKRGDQLGVRVKDKENPARLNFKGLEYFPIDPKWRFEAKLEPYRPPKILEIPSMIGTVEKDSCPGALVFKLDGKEYRLDVVIEKGSEDQFFIMMSDETSGKETYTVGRQLYATLPDSDGNVVLDFNKAYNWPCVFTVFATCPIPPKQNHLPIRVEAGEKMYAGHE
ncbi:MAG: DUF1684 domain-containing protein [Ignavibacteriae bacterium]|nr:DUF1684 domain-containing protein [Ignavibacteria bacterium]MBI3364939.1 DUF1684 domain-containing protein [Ignavibacteriota bacterium]